MDTPNQRAALPELEHWAVEHELGSGGSGTVYVVRQRHTGDRAALKMGTCDADGGGASSAEVHALASMGHQHIVELIGTVSTDRGEGILMEYLPGGSVADLIAARGPLTLGEAVTVVAPIAGALSFLHGHGVVHGDIAPGNVLFTAEGLPKLADLGLAVLVGGRQSESGTPGFRAPSIDTEGTGGRRLRPARDVYSLAALAWYMLTGRVAGPTRQRPPLSSLLGEVPMELVELLEAGLSEDEQDRPGAEEFGRRIFEVAKPQPVNLRLAVRAEALGQMVTHVVADPAARPAGRGLAAWFRGATSWKSRSKRQPRRRKVGQSRRGPRHGRRWAVACAAVLLCALAVGALVVFGAFEAWAPSRSPGGNRSTAPEVQSSVAESPVPPADGATSAAATTTPPVPDPAAPSLLETAVFSEPVPEDPVKAAGVLTARRDLALAAADSEALRQVHAPVGESLGPDLATCSQLRSRGLHYRGLETRLTEATVRAGTSDRHVDVAFRSTIGTYEVIGADGATVQSTTEPEVQDIVLELERVEGGWLISSVKDAAQAAGSHGWIGGDDAMEMGR